MRYTFALAALLLAWPCFAQAPANLSWTNATTNTNGTAIPATGAGSLTRTTVDYGTCGAGGAFGTKQGEIFVAAPANTATVSMVVIQQYCFRAWHTNTFGNTSGFSNVATKNNPAPTPGPPNSLTVAADLTAWTIVTTEGAVVALEVGRVAPGTACDTSQHVQAFGRPGTLYRVPEGAVTFLPGQTALVTFASCGG